MLRQLWDPHLTDLSGWGTEASQSQSTLWTVSVSQSTLPPGGGDRASLAVCSASEGLGGPLLLQQPPSQAEGQQLSTQPWQAEEREVRQP